MKAPSFSLKDQNNNTVKLVDFKGKKLVLYCYPKADTPGCTVQACGIRDNIAEIKKLGAVVVGLSPDEPSKLKKFEEKYHLNFTLIGDPSHDILKKLGVWKKKSFMGREYMGVARTTFLIDEKGSIIKTYPDVNPATHAHTIIKDLSS